jgi:hypothetical protein
MRCAKARKAQSSLMIEITDFEYQTSLEISYFDHTPFRLRIFVHELRIWLVDPATSHQTGLFHFTFTPTRLK